MARNRPARFDGWLTALLVLIAVLLSAYLATASDAAPTDPALQETRYCGQPARLADGSIRRRADVRGAFKREHPCPVTGLRGGTCAGWEIDHVIPLACGGCDAVANMQWLPSGLKSVAVIGKDRFERRIYGGVVAGTACEPPPLK